MVIFTLDTVVTPGWQIPGTSWAVIFPLALVAGLHLLFPVCDFSCPRYVRWFSDVTDGTLWC